MINNVAFMGRETMLTKPVKNTANEVKGFVGISKVYTKDEVAEAEKLADKAKIADDIKQKATAGTYTSPFAPIPDAGKKEAQTEIKHLDIIA